MRRRRRRLRKLCFQPASVERAREFRTAIEWMRPAVKWRRRCRWPPVETRRRPNIYGGNSTMPPSRSITIRSWRETITACGKEDSRTPRGTCVPVQWIAPTRWTRDTDPD
ncbi:hypothetical protein ANANG_G00198260 [Anguilla anguilla]|uniref:Uncharacterized protein n=1 Tax=Anguilla anguilla TaxID=7936 RepID=A0A9D3RVU3_ANGAN|nr:hypothetical protein ANANG_G00198260 [Anguilla anguilla]